MNFQLGEEWRREWKKMLNEMQSTCTPGTSPFLSMPATDHESRFLTWACEELARLTPEARNRILSYLLDRFATEPLRTTP